MKLIVFFNGWGMDENVVSHLKVPANHVLEVVNFPYKVNASTFNRYEEIIFIGWSFGSYYLARYLSENSIKYKKAISVNGSPETIGKNGISEKIFNFTLNTLTPDTLQKFYKNMEIDTSFLPPLKNFYNIKEELQYFKDNYIPQKNVFTHAFIGKNDKIISAANQKRFFNSIGTAITELSCGHYPFFIIKDWFALIGE